MENLRNLESPFILCIQIDIYFLANTSYAAIKCASALREAMWSMVSETRSEIDFGYVAYTGENLERFERAWEAVA